MIAKDSLAFLKDLKKNNHREWFLEQKKRYEAYKKDYHALVQQFIDELKKQDESLSRLEVKDCTFRINRDIRFSKDKSPYKTNMALWFSPGNKNWNQGGYYVHIEPGASFIAGGFYQPEADDLRKIRSEIAFFHEELEAILNAPDFKKTFGTLNSEGALKTAPKGYEKDHPAIELLKNKSFTASCPLTDKELESKDFVKEVSKKLMLLKPLNEFLNRAVGN